MQFHPDKCQLLRIIKRRTKSDFNYSIHSSIIEYTREAKYLGITISDTLSWNSHINNISKKANGTINFLHRNFKNCSPKVKAGLYLTYVRPSLEYCSSVWDPHTSLNIDKLEGVQRRAARFVYNKFSREIRVTPMLQDLKWVPLSERRARSKTTLMYKALHNLINIPTDHLKLTQSHTRQHSNFYIPFVRTDAHRSSFYPSTLRLWNTLPILTRTSPTLETFKSNLKDHTFRYLY